ncbi:MAG TPA: NEW3 domain-containing protein [Chloroflexota bacterium]|jgi:uncharacterized membrane protein
MLKRLSTGAFAALLLGGLLAVLPSPAAAAPIPDVAIYADYPTITVQPGKNVKFTVRFANNGTVDREIDLNLTGPDGWNPQLKNQSFLVRRVYLAAGKTQTADFSVDPPANADKGDYTFRIAGVDTRGAGETDLDLVIGVQDTGLSGIKLTSQYAVLQGGADKPFGFKADLVNQSDEDRDFTLAAQAPDGWQVTFQPAYDKTQISGIRLKAGETKGLDISVTPARTARAGDYPITIGASAGTDTATVPLKVQITGNYKLTLSTPSGALNANATAGDESRTTLVVQNSGSGDVQNVALSATKPDGWDVSFQPATIDRIAANGSAEVAMGIKPSGRAIPGDYMVQVTASNPQVSEQASIRTTVGSPTTWGVVGLGIIAVSLGGLYGVFRRFSRR